MSLQVLEKDIIAVQKIWDFMKMDHELIESDIIIVFGNHDVRTAEYASRLWLDGWAKWLMFSGKDGIFTKGKWNKTEAEVFHDVAISYGIPDERIILEKQATNTGQNVTFSYEILKSLNFIESLQKLILVQMPFMERRVYATFMKQWPGNTDRLHVIVTSPNIPMREYPNKDVGTLNDLITAIIGCLYRIKTYPDVGFQIPQEIPLDVWESYMYLVNTGSYR